THSRRRAERRQGEARPLYVPWRRGVMASYGADAHGPTKVLAYLPSYGPSYRPRPSSRAPANAGMRSREPAGWELPGGSERAPVRWAGDIREVPVLRRLLARRGYVGILLLLAEAVREPAGHFGRGDGRVRPSWHQ